MASWRELVFAEGYVCMLVGRHCAALQVQHYARTLAHKGNMCYAATIAAVLALTGVL